ncbi:hypothetical protein VRRI112168_03550 [Vreelandella rituensis]|uniref:Uncharacterized protein n=1 Tax=Vreelandella rituensis TaxID=2282306 RepID=A0A368U942_9GAMM|nr:hypothetical protein [Halomonas rituensis]RCV93728.1 hypothetical protein DU506_00820 [Halomonas rituensis]
MPLKRLALIIAMGTLVAGCQTTESQPSIAEPAAPAPQMHLQFQGSPTGSGDISHVAKDVSLRKAIKHAFPDATIVGDPGVDLDSPVSVWVENVSPVHYLDQLGRAAGLSITHDDEVIHLSTVARWNFTLPRRHEATARVLVERIDIEAAITVVESSEDFITLLVTGPAWAVPSIKAAIHQLGDQTALDDVFAGQ